MRISVADQEALLLADLTASADRARKEQEIARNLVYQLRKLEVPWETIGRTLHITKQGAQQRFSA